uniref:NADH-ubiquinone oxidoreductase chain 1 n=1 Tax=Naesiotus nux TaxID=1755238 RepID=A0A0S2IAT5_NAENU|nr:NADH dehydrogenase subunit 1 [Naesiotus nux]ALO20559.1 NADH dehydrogenase subunit 1 [Naesiotus nux]
MFNKYVFYCSINLFMIMHLINNLILCLCILLSVAFYTLLERKVLGVLQMRKGPNVVGLWGIIQPLSDALKLLIKENNLPFMSNKFIFISVPIIGLTLSLFMWILMPSEFSLKSSLLSGILLFMCLSSLSVFIILLSGWSSNSKYAFLGALRAAAQSISYEISMALVLLFPILAISSLSWYSALKFLYPTAMLFLSVLLIWFVTALAETNRAPFDFAEGESELVSGFNIEYGGGLFVLLFLSEYSNILFLSMLTSIWFISFNLTFWFYTLICLITAFFFLLVRGVYPRHRYDLLMMLCWKVFLPISLCKLMFMSGLLMLC